MGRKDVIELLVEGGKAAPGASSAPKLSMYKLDIGEIFKQVNEKTKDYGGMQVPVKIEVDTENKSFEIKIGTPPVSSMIKKEAGIELAKITDEEKAAGKTVTGNLTFDKIVKIAKIKHGSMLSRDLKSAVKEVIGTANSMTGVMIENKRPKELIKEVDEGKWDSSLK